MGRSGLLSSILRMTDRLSILLRRSTPLSSSSSSSSSSSDPPPTIEDDLNELRTTMLSIEDVINDAENKEIQEEAVRLWLCELRGVAYGAEDVLDEVEYEFLRCRVETAAQTVNKKRKQKEEEGEEVAPDFNPPAPSPLDDFSFRARIASRIKDVKERLDEIARDREALHLAEEDAPRREQYRPRPPATSFVEQSEVYGREVDRINLMKLLFCEPDTDVSVIPIVGMAGVGKTTLVQLIYKDARVQEHFATRGWFYVSENFNVSRLMKEIIESLSERPCELTELVALQQSLKEVLSGNRFLLVLDDVWNQEESLWKELRSALHSEVKGSKVIVTTRNEGVAKIMKITAPDYHLNCLSDDDCWLVFSKRAFDGRRLDAHPNLTSIGRRISNKCRGLPLAAKALGGLLRYEDDQEQWIDLLESNLWDVDEAGEAILPALRLSYRHLPTHLKECFLYCSLFPKNYPLRRDQLIKLWMVQGFIQSHENDELEDIAWDYFDDLLWRSFFQHKQLDYGDKETFVMHDLIHDLALSITGERFSLLENADLQSLSSEARHASVYVRGRKSEIRFHCAEKPKAVRSLLLIRLIYSAYAGLGLWQNHLRVVMPNDVFSNLRCLRVLDLSYTSVAELPDSISNLKLLRYLDLRNTKVVKLPESVCELYHLQIMDLEYCNSLKELPRGLGMMINLRHVHLPTMEHAVICMPSGLGRLTGLQELQAFNVGADGRHCAIGELKNMACLGGDLYISGLRNVARGWDAKEAELVRKKNLRRLTLDWYVHQSDYKCSHNENQSDKGDKQVAAMLKGGLESSTMPWMRAEEENMVLENLQPHISIVVLVIKHYGSTTFPRWLGDPSFNALVTLQLWRCENCDTLPTLGMLPSLKNLYVVSLCRVRCVGLEFFGSKGFPALEKLEFCWMPEWEEWHWPEVGTFPQLMKLKLQDCPKLKNMQRRLIPMLKKLKVADCPQITILPITPLLSSLYIGGICQESIWAYTDGFTELQTLKIDFWENLTCLQLHNFCALKLLSIQSCSQLTAIDCRGGNAATDSCAASSSSSAPLTVGFQSLTALENLKIEQCPVIQFTKDECLPPRLKSVEISCCPMLLEWCDGPVVSEQLASIPKVLVEDIDIDQFNAFVAEMANEEEMDEDEMNEEDMDED